MEQPPQTNAEGAAGEQGNNGVAHTDAGKGIFRRTGEIEDRRRVEAELPEAVEHQVYDVDDGQQNGHHHRPAAPHAICPQPRALPNGQRQQERRKGRKIARHRRIHRQAVPNYAEIVGQANTGIQIAMIQHKRGLHQDKEQDEEAKRFQE